MFPRYFSGEITNWPRLPCYSLPVGVKYVGDVLALHQDRTRTATFLPASGALLIEYHLA